MGRIAPTEQEMLKKIEAMKGEAFDQQYLIAQMEGYQKLLRIQEDYLSHVSNVASVGIAKIGLRPDQGAHSVALGFAVRTRGKDLRRGQENVIFPELRWRKMKG